VSIDTRVIRAEPHVEIGMLIQRDGASIVERWLRRVVVEQPNAKRVHDEVLRDSVPKLLQAMGHALKTGDDPEPAYNAEAPQEHGEQRWDTGWSLSELVRDYQILRLVILEYLEEVLARPLRYREGMAVGVFIDDAVAASIVAYVASRDADMRQIDEARAEALQDANRRKDEFIAALAHELRNPLAPLVNSIRVLQLLVDAEKRAELDAIEVIDRQARQLTRLVDDLLDLARIAEGRLELRRTHLDLTMVLEQAVQTSDPMLKARGHQLTVEQSPVPLVLEADAARLIQIFVNLLNNAAKYTDRGGRLWLSAARDGNEAVIRVRDNGIGIPPEMISRVFDMFVQTDVSRRRSQEGLGIGLTLVRRLVELHGGTVSVQSAGVGQGCEFVVRLPVQTEAVSTPQFGVRHPTPASCHLLLIEDHVDARESMATLLTLHGHRVDVAEDGRQGIARALATRPQAALIDIGLPDLSGYEVAQRLRAELGDQIMLIALTGYGQTDDLRKALDAGYDGHLVKPGDFDELAHLLARAPKSSPRDG
jgi:signal transduction histidine kinase/CheY-like chemotaxis protein